jgi:hypothetical protein
MTDRSASFAARRYAHTLVGRYIRAIRVCGRTIYVASAALEHRRRFGIVH